MIECDFDKNAEAMVLFDKGQLDYIIGNGLDLIHHVRIKILNEKGKNQADIRLPYYSWKDDERIEDISAQVYNLDPSGNIVITKLDKKQVFEKIAFKCKTLPGKKQGDPYRIITRCLLDNEITV